MKVYTDDPLVSYGETDIKPERSKDEINAKLIEYHVSDVAWHWKPELGDIYVIFGIEETINGKLIKVQAKVSCPVIWRKAVSKSKIREHLQETIDLKASMRAMYWYIKSHLESAYAMQSTMLAGFLPNIVTNKNETFFKNVLEYTSQFAALPEPAKQQESLDITTNQNKRINVTNI